MTATSADEAVKCLGEHAQRIAAAAQAPGPRMASLTDM